MKVWYVMLLLTYSVGWSQSVDDLFDMAENSVSNNNWGQALSQFSLLLEDNENSLSDIQKANIYNNVGFIYLQLQEHAKAENFLTKSIGIHEQLVNQSPLDLSQTLQNMGLLYMELAEFDLAMDYLKKGLTIVRSYSSDKAEIGAARSNLGQLYEESGLYNEAFDLYNQNLQFFKDNQDYIAEFAKSNHNVGRILLLNGKAVESENYLRKSIEIYETLDSRFLREKASAIETLALYNEQLGQLAASERNLLEALRIKKSLPGENSDSIIETLNNLGILYQRLGNLEKSKSMFKEVIAKCKESLGVEHPYYATASNNLANIAISLGAYEEAKPLLEESLKVYEKIFGVGHPLAANALNNLARVERYFGNYSLSEAYYKQVLEIDEKISGKEHPDYATTLLNLGILNSVMGNEAEAEGYYLDGINIRMSVLGQFHPDFGKALESLGMHYLAIGNLMEAEIYFRVALEIQLSQLNSVFPILTEEERGLFYNTMRSDVERYNFIAFSQLEENPELVKNIFDFQFKTKAILFNSSTRVREEIEKSDEKIQQTYRNWQKQKRMLTNYRMMGTQELTASNIDIDQMEQMVQGLEKELVLKISDFETLFQNEDENWQAVQNLVKKDEAIVEIIRIREFKSEIQEGSRVYGFTNYTKYLAIIFDQSTMELPKYAILGDDYKTEDDWYSLYKNALLFNVEQSTSFETLWLPVHEQLKGVKQVRVSPDGIYYKINPNVFLLPDGEYLIEDYFVSYLTSCKDLFRDPIEENQPKSYFFGNPEFARALEEDMLKLPALPGSEVEIQTVSRIMEENGWRVKTYIGPTASETSLRSVLDPTILHVATHGYFGESGNFLESLSNNKDALFRSGLLLANINDTYRSYLNGSSSIAYNDGILTAYEAMNLDLSKTRLVVLSACESGLGDVQNGEGVFGLQRAFMVAGARNLITSLSKVDDTATKELMILFYQNLTKNNSDISFSLRDAQLKLKEKYKSPNIWGAFMLIGSG